MKPYDLSHFRNDIFLSWKAQAICKERINMCRYKSQNHECYMIYEFFKWILEYSSQSELNEKYFVTFINISALKMQKPFCHNFQMLLDF